MRPQDKAGNMWFGSAGDGIYYYDGKSFLNFTRIDGLCHNDILCCLEDKNGVIWFGTRNGLIRYTPSGRPPERNDFISFLISANTISASTHEKIPFTYEPATNFVWSIMQDKKGKLWFGTNKGVFVCDPSMKTDSGIPAFMDFLDNGQLVNSNHLLLKDVTAILEDRDGNTWFASGYVKGEGICRYDGRSLVNFTPDGLGSFRSVMQRENGELLFLNTFHGVYAYDGKSFSNLTEKIGIKNDTLIAMSEDKAGNLWFGHNSGNMKNGGQGGLWRYDGQSLKLFTTKDGLNHNCVFCIVEERNGNTWFGTRNTGLCRYDGKTFTDFTE
jgi:ligand-binding sensor domain-containing protein